MTTKKMLEEGGPDFSRMRHSTYEKVDPISEEWVGGRVMYWDRFRNYGKIQTYKDGAPAEVVELFSEILPDSMNVKIEDVVEVRWGRGSSNRIIATDVRKREQTSENQ